MPNRIYASVGDHPCFLSELCKTDFFKLNTCVSVFMDFFLQAAAYIGVVFCEKKCAVCMYSRSQNKINVM